MLVGVPESPSLGHYGTVLVQPQRPLHACFPACDDSKCPVAATSHMPGRQASDMGSHSRLTSDLSREAVVARALLKIPALHAHARSPLPLSHTLYKGPFIPSTPELVFRFNLELARQSPDSLTRSSS